MLDADQLLSIMTYVVLQCKMQELPGHLKMIEEFTSQEVQNSRLGQALFTLKAATDNIENDRISRKLSIISTNKIYKSDFE